MAVSIQVQWQGDKRGWVAGSSHCAPTTSTVCASTMNSSQPATPAPEQAVLKKAVA